MGPEPKIAPEPGLREKDIEEFLRDKVREAGGIAYKFRSPQRRNVPDRICVFANGSLVFVECKAPGKVASAGQRREIQRLVDRKQEVRIIDSKEEVTALVRRYA